MYCLMNSQLSLKQRKQFSFCHRASPPGSDAIHAEMDRAGGQLIAEKFTALFHCMWRKEATPQELKDASIIHLYKRKGNAQVCDNYRRVSLLSITGNKLTNILLISPNEHLEQAGILP